MKNFLLLLLILVISSTGCASKKQSESADNNKMKLEEYSVSPAPGTAVAEIQLTSIEKGEDGTRMIDCKVIKVMGYGSGTKPLPEKFEALRIPVNVMKNSAITELKEDEIFVVVLSGNETMGEDKSGIQKWSVIEIQNN